MNALHEQLLIEMERFGLSNTNRIETVFIGGGTPSTVSPELYRPLFETFSPYLVPGCEITAEANPNSATPSWLEGMRALGVNRISFGVQSFNDQKLLTLGRSHRASQASKAVEDAYQAGFRHLSLDLIYGVRGDTKALLEHDIEKAFSLPIDHLSLYALTIEEHTLFERTPEMANEKMELTRWLFKQIEERGFEQYEISNFGRYRSRHNLGYWEHKPYIGLGAGAVGFLGERRFYPNTDVERYITSPLEASVETIEPDALLGEKLFLGFRSIVGVEKRLLSSTQIAQAEMLCREGMLRYDQGRYYNPDFLLADEIALRVEGF